MPMSADDIERLIRRHIPDAEVTIHDLAGDGDHYAATVVSAAFKGKSRVQQHQLVYEALKAASRAEGKSRNDLIVEILTNALSRLPTLPEVIE